MSIGPARTKAAVERLARQVARERDRLATELRVEREEHQRTLNALGDEIARINAERVKLTAEVETLRTADDLWLVRAVRDDGPASVIRLAHEQRDRALSEVRELREQIARMDLDAAREAEIEARVAASLDAAEDAARDEEPEGERP